MALPLDKVLRGIILGAAIVGVRVATEQKCRFDGCPLFDVAITSNVTLEIHATLMPSAHIAVQNGNMCHGLLLPRAVV